MNVVRFKAYHTVLIFIYFFITCYNLCNYVCVMHIPIVSTISNQCSQISIQSNGDSKYVRDGSYEKYVFGAYHFVSTDERGNNIYHANIRGRDWFIFKTMKNNWAVRMHLYKYLKLWWQTCINLLTARRLHLTLTMGVYLLLFIFLYGYI